VVVNDDGGDQVAADWTLTVDGAAADPAAFAGDPDGIEVSLEANAPFAVNETGPAGYAASFSADCTGLLAPGDVRTCTVTNDDIRPHLRVVKHVVNDDGGDQVAADWTLTVDATGADPAAFAGDELGTDVSLPANAPYAVNESGPAGYAASFGDDCAGTMRPGDIRTCTVTNDDIRPRLVVRKLVVNDDGGTRAPGDWTLAVAGADAAPDTFPGNATGTEVSLEANAAYAVSEAGPAGYAANLTADCRGALAPGEVRTCTVTNDDIRPRLTVVKVVVNDDGGTLRVSDVALWIDGVRTTNGTAVLLPAGDHVASETAVAGYNATTAGDCDRSGHVHLDVGDDKVCTITNDDIRPILHVVKHVVNDALGTAHAADFLLHVDATGASPATFAGAESPGVAVSLAAGAYRVTETQDPGYAATYSAGCSGTLAPGDVATCTITNDDIALATRTLGFWSTHTAFTESVFHGVLGGTMPIGTAAHLRTIDSDAKLFGAWQASLSKTTTNAKRTALDQARMVLLQQLVAAKLNCAAFGCTAATQARIAHADADFARSDAGAAAAMTADAGLLDAYNGSGDGAAIPTVLGSIGTATPKVSEATAGTAGVAFWNTP